MSSPEVSSHQPDVELALLLCTVLQNPGTAGPKKNWSTGDSALLPLQTIQFDHQLTMHAAFRATQIRQLAGVIWCYHQHKADSGGVSGPLPVQQGILCYLGQSATALKSMTAQRERSYEQSEHKKA